MAATETATVFLETSLGTRLVVSFPARATTVADLKRQVSAEHAACFPRTGPIVVASFQIKLDGSWFQLTDSMVVEAAFEWVQGPRRLLVEAHELRPHHPVARRKDAKCGTTADAEPSAGRPVFAEDSSQFMLAPAEVPGGGGNHASGSGVSDAPQLKNQQDEVVEVVSCQREDGITLPQESSDSDVDLAIGDSRTGTSLANQENKPQEYLEHVSRQLEDGITISQHSDLATGDSDTSLTNQENKVQGCVEHASVQIEVIIALPQESSHVESAICTNSSSLPNEEDKLHGCAEHASAQLLDGIAMPQESSHFDLATGNNNSPAPNQEDKLQGCAEHASVQPEDVITMPQENSHFDLATGTNNSPLPKQDDKLQGCAEHASGLLEDGISMPQESSDFDSAAGALPMDQQDRFHDGAEHASGHIEGRTSMPQESSDLGVTEHKENDRAGDQQKHIIMEPRGKKRFREEDEADRSIDVNSDDTISPFVSPSSKFVSEKKMSMIEQAKLDSDPLLNSLEDPSHGLLEKPCGGQKEQWTSGVCSEGGINNGPAIPPCAESMGKDKSSDKEVLTQRGDKEEPQIAGCTDKSSCKGKDVPHYVESMNEGNKRPAPNGHFFNKGENEGATSSMTKEHEPCFRRHHRVTVRKVTMSRAMKLYPFRF